MRRKEITQEFREKVIKSAILRIGERFGAYTHPREIRAILRDPAYEVTPRGTVRLKKKSSDL